jgi:pimeloyl-ACP methyl ester carboxylesterase
VTLPYDEAGDGHPLVLLHAGIADRSMWAEHMPALAEAGFRAVALDLPGFGEAPISLASGRGEWEDVLAAMDSLGIERAALVGSSFGGAVALRAALVAPERVAALALFSAPADAIEPSAELEAVWEAEQEALGRDDIDAAVEVVLGAWLQPGAPPELRERVAAMQRRALKLQADGEGPPEPPDPLEEDPDLLTQIEALALLAAGELDMSDFREGAEAMARAMPNARHEAIPGAGHLAPLEQPEAFRELLLEFLRDTPR